MKYDSFKHKRQSIRLKEYDYSLQGLYFVTVCSLNRETSFSNLNVGAGLVPAQSDVSNFINSDNIYKPDSPDLKLSRIDKILDEQWNKIPTYFKNVILDEYVIMPDHFHGILVIDQEKASADNNKSIYKK